MYVMYKTVNEEVIQETNQPCTSLVQYKFSEFKKIYKQKIELNIFVKILELNNNRQCVDKSFCYI